MYVSHSVLLFFCFVLPSGVIKDESLLEWSGERVVERERRGRSTERERTERSGERGSQKQTGTMSGDCGFHAPLTMSCSGHGRTIPV